MDLRTLEEKARNIYNDFNELSAEQQVDALVITLGGCYSTPDELFSLLISIYEKYRPNIKCHAIDLCNIMDELTQEQVRDIVLYMKDTEDCCLDTLDVLDAALTTQKMELCEFLYTDMNIGSDLTHEHMVVVQWLEMALDVSTEEGNNIVEFLIKKGIVDRKKLSKEHRALINNDVEKSV